MLPLDWKVYFVFTFIQDIIIMKSRIQIHDSSVLARNLLLLSYVPFWLFWLFENGWFQWKCKIFSTRTNRQILFPYVCYCKLIFSTLCHHRLSTKTDNGFSSFNLSVYPHLKADNFPWTNIIKPLHLPWVIGYFRFFFRLYQLVIPRESISLYFAFSQIVNFNYPTIEYYPSAKMLSKEKNKIKKTKGKH